MGESRHEDRRALRRWRGGRVRRSAGGRFLRGRGRLRVSVIFRARDDQVPWEGPARIEDRSELFNNTCCLTNENTTTYGGLREVEFHNGSATFRFTPHAAEALRLGNEALEVDFEVSEEDLRAFTEMLRRIVTWGVPSEIPQLRGV